jgi:hypothetical protein
VALRVGFDDAETLACTGLMVGFDWSERHPRPEGAPDRAITARELRAIPLGGLLDGIERLLRSYKVPTPPRHPVSGDELPAEIDAWRSFREHVSGAAPRIRRLRQHRPGRAGRPREHFEEFAVAWQQQAARTRHSPVQALARKYGVSAATIRRWRARSEALGLLGQEEQE